MAGIPVSSPSFGGMLASPYSSLPRAPKANIEPIANPVNPNLGILDQIQQTPAWLQERMKSQMIQPGKVGFVDPSIQLAQLYSSYAPRIQQYQDMYGSDFNQPYFLNKKYAGQTGDGFNAFSQNLYDYQIQGGGDIYRVQRDPISGEIIGDPQLYMRRDEFAYAAPSNNFSRRTSGGTSDYLQTRYNPEGNAIDWNRDFKPYIGLSYADYLSKYRMPQSRGIYSV